VKNRMLEIGTSGTVRGEDGNILTYSALRLEWQGQDGQKETEQPDHSASLSDFTTSSNSDKVFGTHTSDLLAFSSPPKKSTDAIAQNGTRTRISNPWKIRGIWSWSVPCRESVNSGL
jgi:hypothetical protein